MRIAVLDIGGTAVKSGIWTGRAVEEVRETETRAKEGGSRVIERALETLRPYEPFDAVGISSAGQVNAAEGYICYANDNIPGYTGMNIKDIAEAAFHVPAVVDNDVNAAAVGEGEFGAGQDCGNFLCLTYGTGVGGAIVIEKKLYTGSSFSAGEFGGILTHPEDRRAGDAFSGCYERYASASALIRRAMEYDRELKDGRRIFARLSEPEVASLIDSWIDEIVYGLITLIHIFNPSRIILGGGMMEQPYLPEQIRLKTDCAIMSSFRAVEIKQAELGNLAGLYGMAVLGEKLFLSK